MIELFDDFRRSSPIAHQNMCHAVLTVNFTAMLPGFLIANS